MHWFFVVFLFHQNTHTAETLQLNPVSKSIYPRWRGRGCTAESTSKLGHVRLQSMPGDASLQREDLTMELSSGDAGFYRMAVGVCLYLSRDRRDIVFPVKELASRMSKPTIGSLQSLKKLVGYLKSTQGYAVVLEQPVGGSGRWKQSNDKFWVLESFSDSDWSGEQTPSSINFSWHASFVWCIHVWIQPYPGSLAFLLVKVNFMVWFQHWPMACFFDVVQSLLQGPPLNTTC